jgi:DNA/RNA endonuclease YhcR with UshA esterase domain
MAAMNRVGRWVALGALLALGAEVQAHHAVAGVYDLNKEVVLEGQLLKLNFTNPHSNLHLAVPNADGTTTEWILTTASIQVLTRQGINKTSIKPGEILKITALPARNGNPAGFIRSLELGDQEIRLFFGDGTD